MRLLIVEDEKHMASFIQKGLKQEKYNVDLISQGEEALFLAETNDYDLIILDIMLPDKDGISICRQLRRNNNTTPILLLTARDTVSDKVNGLDNGADDFMTKPFAFEEFLARVRALLRRSTRQISNRIKVGDLELDQISHHVKRNGQPILLTSKEYSLLEYFMLNANKIVTRTMLTEHVWDRNYDTLTNSIEVYITFLRKKLHTSNSKPLLHTIHGTGYMFSEQRP